MMRLIDLVQEEAWAIRPEVLDTIHAVLARKLHGDSADLADVEARIGRPLDNSRATELDVRDGVAVIPVRGTLAKRMNLMTAVSGGTSMEILKADISAALEDPAVDAVILDVDSPGGTVAGTMELASWLYAQRGRKPIKAYANELMASAAYWIASAADSVAAQATSQLGSIGVITAHYDYSQYDAKMGVKRTMLYAGRYKAVGNNAEPLSQEARDYIQERLDQLYTLFVDGVAANRGIPSGDVLERMADGKIFLGKEALAIGLVDTITNSLDDLVQATAKEMHMSLTLEKLRAEHPDLVEALQTEWDAETASAIAEAEEKARSDAQERLLELHAAVFGEKAGEKFAGIVATGATAEQVKAFAELMPKGDKSTARSDLLDQLQAGDVGASGDTKTPKGEVKETFMDKVEAHMKEEGCSRATAIKACVKLYPDLHQAYLDEVNKR